MFKGLVVFLLLLPCAVVFSDSASASVVASCGNFLGPVNVPHKSLNFNTVEVGESRTLSFVIQNPINNEQTAEIYSIKSQSDAFVVLNPLTNFCMKSGSQVTINVAFMPDAPGGIRSQIEIVHSDFSRGGIAPNSVLATSKTFVTVAGIGALTDMTATPSALNFGAINLGQSLTKTFTLQNGGKVTEQIKQITSNLSNFVVLSPGFPQNLSLNGSINVQVRFTPTSAQNYSGKLLVVDELGDTEVTVPVSGSGLGAGGLLIKPLSLDFGTMGEGTFKDLPLIISNTGQASATISSFNFTDLSFETSPGAPLTIGAGKSSAVLVRFKAGALPAVQRPQSTKLVQKEVLTLHTNLPQMPSVNVQLSANVVAGKIGFVPDLHTPFENRNIHTNAVQWVDYNNDDMQDLYFCGSNGNLLYKNVGKGNFVDVTKVANVGNDHNNCQGASWADVDNDGDLDLAIFNASGPPVLLKNNHFVFSIVSGGPGLIATDAFDTAPPEGGIWLDFNNDGNVDLFVVRNGAPDQLFKSTGLFHFTDVSAAAHVNFNGPGRACVAGDINGDGYPDIYVVNENAPNKLYLNNKNETFREAGVGAGVAFNGDSQEADLSDYDGDGDLDLFVVNGDGPSVLYENLGQARFQDVSSSSGIQGPQNGKSATFNDVDNDGDQDLILVQSPGSKFLFKNLGNGKFTPVSNVDLADSGDPDSATSGDSDNDGQNDAVVGDSGNQSPTSNTLYQNTGDGTSHYLTLVLVGTESNKSAIGATVVLRAGLILQAQQVSSGNGQNENSLPLEFGLGPNTTASLIIQWPSGKVQNMSNVAADQTLTITEPQ